MTISQLILDFLLFLIFVVKTLYIKIQSNNQHNNKQYYSKQDSLKEDISNELPKPNAEIQDHNNETTKIVLSTPQGWSQGHVL